MKSLKSALNDGLKLIMKQYNPDVSSRYQQTPMHIKTKQCLTELETKFESMKIFLYLSIKLPFLNGYNVWIIQCRNWVLHSKIYCPCDIYFDDCRKLFKVEEVEINNYRGSSTLCNKCIKPSSDNVKDPHYCSDYSCESLIKHLEEYSEKRCYYHIILLVYIKGMYTDFFKIDEELSPRIHSCDPIIIRTKKTSR